MIDRVIRFSIQNRIFILLLALLLVGAGVWSATQLPIDAVPDITNRQVVINAAAPALVPEEVERQISFPLEVALAGLPRLQETRSISQFGLSQVTAIFDDSVDIYFARQLVNERLQEAKDQLPAGVKVEMGPISTGLGEIYMIQLAGGRPRSGQGYSLMDRRTMVDWIVRPQLRTVPGLAEVNTWGGLVKQYQVLVDPQRLRAYALSIRDVTAALAANNQNAGGAYITRGQEQQLVGTAGTLHGAEDIRRIVIAARDGVPITIGQVATVAEGGAVRQGAITQDGQGEQVYAIPMLLMGENGRVVVQRVKEKMAEIQRSLPAGATLIGHMDRSQLIDRTIHTAASNLVEGGLLVIGVLFLFLLQLQAGLIVSSAIPLAMLAAIIGMKYYGVSANLMSLGAIDFGLIVDGAVIIVENCVRRLSERRAAVGRDLTEPERLETLYGAAVGVRKASQFGEVIIIAAYLPILTLSGIEGKMFRPMGFTVILALVGALVLSLTLIPALCAFSLQARRERENPFVLWLARAYVPALRWAMSHRYATVGGALLFFALCASLFPMLGSVFIPELDEGAIGIEARFAPSISLERDDPEKIGRILVPAPVGLQIPLSQLADIRSVEGPAQISRENGQRRIAVQANVRGRDLGSFVQEVQKRLGSQLRLPVGYHLEYGGTYEHLQSGRARLMLVVPITFGLIFLLLFATFGSLRQAALVFTGIPLAVTGGILALLFRGMPFSISAGIGFIALFGVAVLNGVVLVSFINELRERGAPVHEAVVRGSLTRLRPVLMTAAVASIGFIPMAVSRGAGAEVQRPLATVVIGGLITSTLLTLFVLPTLYAWFEREKGREVETVQ